MNADLVPGRHLPDFGLPDHVGNQRSLSDLAGNDPMLLHFYRGWWCPKEQAYFRKLLQLQDEAEVAYTRFVSVSVDTPEESAAFRAGLGARWTFLSDHERRCVHELGLLETTDRSHNPFVPTVLVLEPDLRIHAAFNGYWFWGRPTNEELRQAFRTITRSIRSDWEVPAR